MHEGQLLKILKGRVKERLKLRFVVKGEEKDGL